MTYFISGHRDITPEEFEKYYVPGIMKAMVESKTKGTVEFETEVNPDIIGGFVLEYDTYRLDASVQSQLRGILSQLSKQTV